MKATWWSDCLCLIPETDVEEGLLKVMDSKGCKTSFERRKWIVPKPEPDVGDERTVLLLTITGVS